MNPASPYKEYTHAEILAMAPIIRENTQIYIKEARQRLKSEEEEIAFQKKIKRKGHHPNLKKWYEFLFPD